MSKIQIMTDSVSDIPVEDEIKYSIPVIPIVVSFGNESYRSRVDMDNDKFFELMSKYDGVPTTSQVTAYEFVDIYLEQAKSGVNDLILVLLNAKGSATYDNSVRAADMFYEEHPEYRETFRIHSIDGMGYCALYGAVVIRAAQMRDDGATADEIVKYIKETIPRRRIFFGIYDLKYAAKSGRIPTAAAFIGKALNLKPIMRIADGKITTAAKCLGERKLIKNLIDMTVEEMEPDAPYEILYASDKTCLEELRKQIVPVIGYEPAAVYQTGAAVAANAGPRVVGVAFLKKQS